MIKFSIILPVYNAAATISDTLVSVLNQTHKNFEIIIINDGSTDHSLDIISKFDDCRIQVFDISNSGGPARPRNIGLSFASGDWVAFIDSDDLWHVDKLKIISETLEIEELDFISHGTKMYNLENHYSFIHFPQVQNFSYLKLLINGNTFVLSSIIISRSFLVSRNLKFKESSSFSSVEDFQFILECFKLSTLKVKILSQILTTYIIHPNGISKSLGTHLKNLRNLYFYNLSNFKSFRFLYYGILFHSLIFLTKYHAYNNKLILKYLYLFVAIICNPILIFKKINKKFNG